MEASKRVLLWLFFSAILTVSVFCAYRAGSYKECRPEESVCEFWLVIEEMLTMVRNKDLVYAHDGKLYKYDEHWSNYTTYIPISEVISVDGVNRMVTTANRTIPGPSIIVYEDQQVIVHVQNKLLSDSTSIHWHGLHQKGTPWMDGVAYISQCPIAAGQTFTYKFQAQPRGTFWYHSHIGAQRTNGLFGAFIIKEKPKKNVTPPKDMIMTVGDWHHHQSTEVYVKMVYGNYINGKKYKTTRTLDGGKFSGVPWVSGLIEGKGRYFNQHTGSLIKAPLTQYNVTKGAKYRFRVIAVGSLYPLRISVDSHNLTLVASDGYDLKQRIVESIIINPGERFDFLLDANQPVGNYWVRAVSMEHNVENHTVEAILHYDGANDTEPTTIRRHCTVHDPCHVVNCPFPYFPQGANTFCLTFNELEANDNDPAPQYQDGHSEEHFLNFAFPGEKVTPGSVNGRKFEFPGVSSLTQPNEIGDYDCSNKKHDCGVDKVCYCHYNLKFKYDRTVQMIWTNMGSGKGWSHPVHLHGHSFYVLKMGYPVCNQTTAKITGQNPDVYCGGPKNFCNAARWMNSTWKPGNVPGLNLKNPPRKDTIIVPTGGYVVVRIRSNNPGRWFMHCHIEVHSLDGMAMFIDEAPDQQPKPPKGFPICQNFYHDNSRDVAYTREPSEPVVHKKDTFDKFAITLIIAVILGVIILVGLIVIIAHRYQTKAPSAMTFNKSVEHMDKGSTGYVNKGLSNE